MAVFRCRHPIPDTCPSEFIALVAEDSCPECREKQEYGNDPRKNVLISNVSSRFWGQLKSQAALEGETIPVFLERIVGEYITNAQG